MRRFTAAGAIAAAAIGTAAPALPAAGASAPEPVDDRASAEHCVVQAATGRDPRTQTTLGCFETFAAAQQAAASSGSGGSLSSGALTAESSPALAAPMAAGSVTLGWHFEHHNGGGASVVIVGSSCSSTWSARAQPRSARCSCARSANANALISSSPTA